MFVAADGAERGELGWEAAGTILADEAPKCATSGDGLNLVKPTLGRGETGRRTRCGDVTLLFNGYPLKGITAEVDVVLEGANSTGKIKIVLAVRGIKIFPSGGAVVLIHHPKVSRSLGDHKSWSDIAPVCSFKEWLVNLTRRIRTVPIYLFLINHNFRNISSHIERFSNDCRKTKTKAITPTKHNRSKQRDEPITIPSNYL